jgi:glycosyltransferase involved in cell wall biosynthesis
VNKPRYSVIIPVYNRPDDVRELLESLKLQTRKDFEVIVVEDGSAITCEEVTREFTGNLNVRYYYKPNSGPGPSRNFGFVHALGEYFVVFDSDCILPPTYFETVDKALAEFGFDAWGGPDQAHADFTFVQRAMGYSMSSWLTTGGIRGGKLRMGWFQPRSFNMGISKKVFDATGGFRFARFAEDIEFSIRMKKAGFSVGLIASAFVYHKRRTSFLQFFKQVYAFGRGRALVGRVHPEEVKITHWFPTLFTLGSLILPLLYLINALLFKIAVTFLGAYLVFIFVHSLVANRNFVVACLAIPSALLQLWGYGFGFLIERLKKARPMNAD